MFKSPFAKGHYYACFLKYPLGLESITNTWPASSPLNVYQFNSEWLLVPSDENQMLYLGNFK